MRGRMLNRWLLLLLIFIPHGVLAQDSPGLGRCFDRAQFMDPPWVNGTLHCLEHVYSEPNGDELAITALAAGPDGTLYAARPLDGEIIALSDSDADGLPDQPQVIIEGLLRPNGLAYHEDALYIATSEGLYRWASATLTLLTNDVPVLPGGWISALAIGPDERLYIAIPAGCDSCELTAPGQVLSYTLDGTDKQTEAEGLRWPGGLAFREDTLWVTDSVPSSYDNQAFDELNSVTAGAHFGWPYCAPPDDGPTDFDCASATAPALTLPPGSTPLDMVYYAADTLPDLTDALIVTLYGSQQKADLRGYIVMAIQFNEAGQPHTQRTIVPAQAEEAGNTLYSTVEMNYRGSGFWPRRPLRLAISPEGWVYLSVSGGQIIALRPPV